MKYSAALIVSALAVLARAVKLTNTDYTVTEGAPFTLTWTESQDPVTIKLKTGSSNDLKDVTTITSSGSGGSFTWTPGSLPSGTYAFEIIDSSGQTNYSPQWSYQGTGTLSASSSTASSTTASASTSASSSSSASTTGTSSTEAKSTTSSARLTSTTMTPLTNSTTLSTSTSASTTKGSSTASTTSTSVTSSSSTVPNTNNGQRIASSLALVFGAVAAFIAFN